jgi:hypothetical protein
MPCASGAPITVREALAERVDTNRASFRKLCAHSSPLSTRPHRPRFAPESRRCFCCALWFRSTGSALVAIPPRFVGVGRRKVARLSPRILSGKKGRSAIQRPDSFRLVAEQADGVGAPLVWRRCSTDRRTHLRLVRSRYRILFSNHTGPPHLPVTTISRSPSPSKSTTGMFIPEPIPLSKETTCLIHSTVRPDFNSYQ